MTPTTDLVRAETALVLALQGATRAVDRIARDRTAEALDSLRQAADGARRRLAADLAAAAELLGELRMDILVEVEALQADVRGSLPDVQKDELDRARGVMLGILDSAIRYEESQLNTPEEPAHEAPQDTTHTEPTREPAEGEIASPRASQETDNDNPDMVDLGWEPTQEELDPAVKALVEAADEAAREKELETMAAANPPVDRDDRTTQTREPVARKKPRRKPR